MFQLYEKDFEFSLNGKPRITDRRVKGKPGLVMFKTDWCGFCQRAKPEFKASSEMLGKSAFFATVDCDKSKKLAEKMGIKGFPTIYFVNKKGELDGVFTGERSKFAFNQYMCVRGRACL